MFFHWAQYILGYHLDVINRKYCMMDNVDDIVLRFVPLIYNHLEINVYSLLYVCAKNYHLKIRV